MSTTTTTTLAAALEPNEHEPMAAANTAEVLRAYLSAYWLRPENAFWMSLRSKALARERLGPPSADLSCGDGIFTFLHCGGRFDDSFDVFQTVGQLDRVAKSHADMFDFHDADYAPPVMRRPSTIVDIATDLKPALLAKADALGFYRTLIQHDNNHPLPFADEELASVYCNSAYWVKRIDAFLRELARVTQPDGAIVLHVKLADMAAYTLEAFRPALGDRFLEIIGRGRQECWPTVATRSEWEQRFRAAGLAIVDAHPFVTRTHAQIWDIGLRPIAPLLVRMANHLTAETRLAIKRDWLALFAELLEPIGREDFDLFGDSSQPAEIQYVLRPQA